MKRVAKAVGGDGVEGDAVSSPMASTSKIEPQTRELLSKIKVLIQCSICRDDIFEPLRTPCDHYFCSKCISDYLESRSKETNNKTGTKLGIQCPNCKSKITKRALVSAPQLNDLFLNIMTANDAYKSTTGHSVIGTDPVVFSARKRVPSDPDNGNQSPLKKRKSKETSKSKTVIEEVIEEDDEVVKPKGRKKKAECEILKVKRKLTKKLDKDVYSFPDGSDEDHEPVNKKAVTASSRKVRPKKSSMKDCDSDASSVGKRNKSSKTDKVSKKSTSKSTKKKVSSVETKVNGEEETEKEKDEEMIPPPSPKVKPKPLRKVSKPKDDRDSLTIVPPTSEQKKSTDKAAAIPSTTKNSEIKKPLSVRTAVPPASGRTKLPLISPLKRREQIPVELDFDLTVPARPETTLQEKYRETISKVISSSTPILPLAPRPTLRNTMSPVLNGVALVMSDDEEGAKPKNSSSKAQEKSSNMDELLKEVEKKSMDGGSDDDMQPIMEIPNKGYSRRLSAASSDHSMAARTSNNRFNDLLRKKMETKCGNKSIQTDPPAEKAQLGSKEEHMYKRLSKLFEALCTQQGVEGTINIEGIGRIEMKLTKGRDSTGSVKGSNEDHCLSQVVSFTKEKDIQTNDVEFKAPVDFEDVSCQAGVDAVCCQVQTNEVEVRNVVKTASIAVQTDEVLLKKVIETVSIEVQTNPVEVKEAPELVDIASSNQSTQTETKDHAGMGWPDIGNAKVDTAVGSQNVKSYNRHTSSHHQEGICPDNYNVSSNLGSDFSQSILDMLEEEDKRKKKNENGEVIAITETPPRLINSSYRRSSSSTGNNTTVFNNTTLSVGQTTAESSRRSLMSSFADEEGTILESDPE